MERLGELLEDAGEILGEALDALGFEEVGGVGDATAQASVLSRAEVELEIYFYEGIVGAHLLDLQSRKPEVVAFDFPSKQRLERGAWAWLRAGLSSSIT